MPKRLTAILASGLALAGCETIYAPPHPLEGTTWELVDVRTSGTSTQLTPELSARHTLTFESGGSLRIRLDCNRGSADWSASRSQSGTGSITIGPVAGTRAFCPRPTFGEELAAELPEAIGYTLSPDGGGLTIRTPEIEYGFSRY